MSQPPIKKRKGDVLGGLVASVQETAREVGGLHARDAAKGAASLVAKEQSLKGANVEASLANALNALRTAAQGIGGAIEVECRIGVACEKGAGLGSATAAAKRFVAGSEGAIVKRRQRGSISGERAQCSPNGSTRHRWCY